MIIAEPPAIYDVPFPGQVVELRLSYAEADAACRMSGQRTPLRIMGCVFLVRADLCVVVIPLELVEPRLGALRRHERGHCNGWPFDHGSSR